ncbi:MAG: Holliday junction resolvase, partial [Treponema sp.]|nr:Holliday junction resolvase [Treponema sp.]
VGKPIDEVLFIEVKSGKSQLSEREKQIRSAIKNGRIRYVEYRLP